ncbi:GxxExxY protein [candidate division KSB1 bacterium]|nr:GxxExxY protein [candidate division KSB1 bacterium]
MKLNEITGIIINVAFEIHTTLGPGLLESVYEVVMAHELANHGLKVERQVVIPIQYKDLNVPRAFCVDLVVENKVFVELKSVETLHKVEKKKVLTYIKLADTRLGLLINFGEALIRDGIVRLTNGYIDE